MASYRLDALTVEGSILGRKIFQPVTLRDELLGYASDAFDNLPF